MLHIYSVQLLKMPQSQKALTIRLIIVYTAYHKEFEALINQYTFFGNISKSNFFLESD